MFVDKVKVKLVAGKGGNGMVSFRHEKFVDRGGPDGGDGGDGGDIVAVGSNSENTLAAFRYKREITGEPGQPGTKRKRHGKSGEVTLVKLPVGTVITAADGTLIADLTTPGQKTTIAKGGKGGYGNAHFVSSRRQAPKIAEKGEPGDAIEAVLELKMIADVGLVGLPNAGKSTLLSRISNARPEIANYPFTTLNPHLGVVDVDKKNSLLVADIPGLIEGASEGKGLGDEFLRHVERTSVLIHVIDAYQEDITAAYKTIQAELKAYKVDLSARPQAIAINKTEGLPDDMIAEMKTALKKAAPKSVKIFAISAQSGVGLKELLFEVNKQAKKAQKTAPVAQKEKGIPILRLPASDEAWQVVKEDKRFVVIGEKIERFAVRTDFNNEAGIERLREIMRKMGIMHELERQKINPGDKIYFGKKADIGSVEY